MPVPPSPATSAAGAAININAAAAEAKKKTTTATTATTASYRFRDGCANVRIHTVTTPPRAESMQSEYPTTTIHVYDIRRILWPSNA